MDKKIILGVFLLLGAANLQAGGGVKDKDLISNDNPPPPYHSLAIESETSSAKQEEQASVSQMTWQQADATILNELYKSNTKFDLVDGCAIVQGQDFPWDKIKAPANKLEIFAACAKGRDLSQVRTIDFLNDIANEALMVYGFVTTEGDDRGSPDIRIRHFSNHLGMSNQELMSAYASLGYHPSEKMTKGKRKLNLQ